jgi:hypothetical protein
MAGARWITAQLCAVLTLVSGVWLSTAPQWQLPGYVFFISVSSFRVHP